MPAFAAKLAGLLIVFGMVLVALSASKANPASASPVETREVKQDNDPPGNPSTPAPGTPTPVTPIPGPAPTPQAVTGLDISTLLDRVQQERRMRREFPELPQIIAQMLRETPAEVGVAVRRLDGSPLFLYNERQPFPLASVAKIYLMVAYLDRLEAENRLPTTHEIEMLQAIIEVSDNASAEEIWTSLGGIEGMQSYLAGAALRSLDPASPQLGGADSDPEAWGDAAQTAGEMSLLLGRLREGKLLNPSNTRLANALLGQIIEEHTWGANAGIGEWDPRAKILFKNGWYPADGGWRINTAGIVLPSDGREPYVIVIFGQHFLSYASGVRTVEAIAATINRIMLE